jgi:hypothetical protein
VNETEQAFDSIITDGGSVEDNFEALGLANQLLNQQGRQDAQRIIIDVTDEGSNTLSPSQEELADTFNQTNTTYLAATPNATTYPMSAYTEERQKRPLANMTQDGHWYDLIAGDFGEKFVDEVAPRVVNQTRQGDDPLTLNASESAQKTFSLNTTTLPPDTYNVTVSTQNDTATTTLEVQS